MACKKCGNTKSSPCACKDTALTTPCLTYSQATDPSGRYCEAAENCYDIQCQECVSYCHGDENHMWALERFSDGPMSLDLIIADPNSNQNFGNDSAFTVQNGERLDGILQRMTMFLAAAAEGDYNSYEHSVKWFYADPPTQSAAGGDMVKLHWGPAIIPGNISAVSIWYADATTGPDYAWNQVTNAENLNLANVSEFNITTVLAPLIMPGGTYVFKLLGIDGDDYWNPSAVHVFVTFL
jgi:hypothetical protein